MAPDLLFEPTLEAAQQRIAAVRPAEYARSRNALGGAVTRLSPYITHGFVTLTDVHDGVAARHTLAPDHKFVFELGWRAYFAHVWEHLGSGIHQSLHEGLLPEAAYAAELPEDIRQARTGVPAIDCAVRELYATGYLHNHARMWLASYVVHLRKVHWHVGAQWLYAHLLDGDLASNHLSWQWVAGTGSSKPYLFNADNVQRFAPAGWHSPGTVIDTSYEALDRIARSSKPAVRGASPRAGIAGVAEPEIVGLPPAACGFGLPDASAVAGKNVWLVHPWALGGLPSDLPADTVVLGLAVADFHAQQPWSALRWRFVGERMAQLATLRWQADAASLGAALQGARSVQGLANAHLQPFFDALLPPLATLRAPEPLFKPVPRLCSSFSQWWNRTDLVE